MKKLILFFASVFALSLFQSCDVEEDVVQPEAYQAKWFDSARLNFSTEGERSFIYNINNGTGDEFWGTTEITFDVMFQSQVATASDIAKIEVYIYAEEQVGESYNYIGGDNGKLLTTVTNPAETFQVTVTKDQIFNLFQGEFSTSRNDVVPGDLFEMKWVITGKDGNVFDSRTECFGFNCTYAFSVEEKIVDTWVGEFEYKWIEVGPGTVQYSYTGVNVGSTGIVNFTQDASDESQYNVADMAFGGAYGGPKSGYITFDGETKTLYVYDFTNYKNKWILESVTPEVLTIRWDNYYNQWYNENGVIELRRSDGLEWPEITEIINNN